MIILLCPPGGGPPLKHPSNSHTPAVARQRGQGYFGTQVCRDTFGLQDDVLPLAVVDSRLVADVQDAVARQRIMLKSRPATYMA